MGQQAPIVVHERPAYVSAGFRGACKAWPARDTLLLPYQAAWVRDGSRLKVMEKARQIGLSWATAYRLVSTTSLAGATYDDWVSSRDDLQARLLIDDCRNFAGLLSIAAEDLGERVIDAEKKHSAYVLRYANGRQTHSLSSNPDAQAGKRGRRVLDEFALHPDPRKLYSVAYPGITWGGSMEIISTHRGSDNLFATLIGEVKHKGNPKKISLHTVTLERALEQGFLYKLQCKLGPDDERQGMDEQAYFDFIRSGCADEESFLQEYCCIPADDGAAFLSYEMLDACAFDASEAWEYSLEEMAECANPLYVGVDIGRDHDLTVIWVLERVGGVFFTRRIIEMADTRFALQEERLYEILRLPSVRRCCIDRTGIGRQFAERARERFGAYRIEEVQFTPGTKEEMAFPVRAMFEDRAVRIPSTPAVRADLRAIRKEVVGGNIRFAADRGKNGHADRFWALALARLAGKQTGDPGRFSVSATSRRAGIRAARMERVLVG